MWSNSFTANQVDAVWNGEVTVAVSTVWTMLVRMWGGFSSLHHLQRINRKIL